MNTWRSRLFEVGLIAVAWPIVWFLLDGVVSQFELGGLFVGIVLRSYDAFAAYRHRPQERPVQWG